jgi:hypothetical protein
MGHYVVVNGAAIPKRRIGGAVTAALLLVPSCSAGNSRSHSSLGTHGDDLTLDDRNALSQLHDPPRPPESSPDAGLSTRSRLFDGLLYRFGVYI